jgi:HEAT repeat protein
VPSNLVRFGPVRRASALFVVLVLSQGGLSRASIWPTAERRAARELADPDVLVRRHAARTLGELPPSAGRRLALTALSDLDAEVRIAAVRAAVELGAESVGARLTSWLTDPDTRVRLAAAEALAARPSRLAVPALARASSDADAKVRASVARALGAADAPDAVVPLLGRLDDPAPEVRREVVNALGHLGDPRAVVPLLAKVEDSSGSVRRAAAHALGLLGDPRAVSALVLVLRDNDESVRVAALEAVGRLGDPSAVSSVVAVLGSGGPAVRAAAAGALGRLATPGAIAALIAELGQGDGDAEPTVRALALAGARSLPPLRACVDGRAAPLLVDRCARALGELGDETDVVRLGAALGRGALTPLAALPALGRLGGARAVPIVLEALTSADVAVRLAAAQALLALLDPAHPDGRAVDPLLSALRRRHTTTSEDAGLLRLLGRTGAPRVGPELARVVREATVPALTLAAVQALGDLGPGPWEALLLDQLAAEDGDIRRAAALSLRHSASARALPALLERLEQRAEQDRAAIGIALPGAASSARDPRLVARLLALFATGRDGERDALIEAIAELPGASPTWVRLARESDPADRAKLAEALAGKAEARPILLALARDPAASVRANAAWSLGYGAEAADLDALTRLVTDRDASVAANATTALGRAGGRVGRDVHAPLCAALGDARALVRASALDAMRLAGARCEEPSDTRLLGSDPSARVRAAAAALLTSRPPTPAEKAALARCAADDDDSDVALDCTAAPKPLPATNEPVLVFVVPPGGSAPAPGVPFALRLADGSERFGVADRRGAVYERRAPAGPLELGVLPAAGD